MHTPLDRADSSTFARGEHFSARTTLTFPRRLAPALGGWRTVRWLMARGLGGTLALSMLWLAASVFEWGTGQRVIPTDPYAKCGTSQPASLPETVRVGLYEEFPAPWRREPQHHVDFPVTLAVGAPTREAFMKIREMVRWTFPQVREVYFWPLLPQRQGYYPGTWSDAEGVRRAAAEAEGLPTLWDLEMPPDLKHPSIRSWPENRAFIDGWLRSRTEPVHLWRSHASMGLDPLFLRMAGMHFDPLDYPAVSLHLDMYEKGVGMPAERFSRSLRCGVERYGSRFIPALGVLDDGNGEAGQFILPSTLRRDLELVRAAGVSEVWLFSVNGLSESTVRMLHETLPLE
jgi:hypothetical protein